LRPDVPTRNQRTENAGNRLLTWSIRCVLAAFMLAAILLAHGCHGKEDTELFTSWIQWTWN
jgi:hypothetical protein